MVKRGNEQANSLAKQGAKESLIGRKPVLKSRGILPGALLIVLLPIKTEFNDI